MDFKRRLKRNLLKNDFIFGIADSISWGFPHKRQLGDSDFILGKLKENHDPIIIDYGSFKIHIDRSSSHDRDVYYDYLNGDFYDPLPF